MSGSTATVDGQVLHPGDAYWQTLVALDDVGRAHSELFGHVRPASTMVVTAALVDPAMMIEVEADVYSPGLAERLAT